MDVKEQIEKAVSSITSDSGKVEEFKKDPVATVKNLLGGAAPKDLIDKVISAVKAKLAAGKLSDAASAIGGLFGKK